MSRLLLNFLVLGWMCITHVVQAQDYSGLARIDPQRSRVGETPAGLEIVLGLSQGVPFRLFTLEAPDRLVIDFKEVDWTGLVAGNLVTKKGAREVRFGGFRPGWSRMVVDLATPMIVSSSQLRIHPETARATLVVELATTDREAFSANSGNPDEADWGVPFVSLNPNAGSGNFVVLIDPGHGGIDPGAERDGFSEKDLMLAFAKELRSALLRVDGTDVFLTREDDSFVSLERRVALAHQLGAHLLVSLHADALLEGGARGATVHTLSAQASDEASALLAERHNRSDMLAGVDLTGKDDVVADVLLDLARMETQPRANNLAKLMIEHLQAAGAPINRRPYRSAAFSVLKAADIPSVLLELGFLSSERDLKHLSDPKWRSKMADALRDAIQAWLIIDETVRSLARR